MKIRKYLARIKRKLVKKPFLKDPKYAPYWFDKILGTANVLIVQIGSNDGKTGDPLNELLMKNQRWKALFVEPVPYIFEKLVQNYDNDDRFVFENVAVNEGQKMEFFWVEEHAKDHIKTLPYWYDQLGSFNRQHIIEELGKEIEPFIKKTILEGATLEEILVRNHIDHLDILHIDTEGYDWKILSQLNLYKYSPKFILFEKNHLHKSELSELTEFLESKYLIFDIGIDGLAVNKSINQKEIIIMKKHLKPWIIKPDIQ